MGDNMKPAELRNEMRCRARFARSLSTWGKWQDVELEVVRHIGPANRHFQKNAIICLVPHCCGPWVQYDENDYDAENHMWSNDGYLMQLEPALEFRYVIASQFYNELIGVETADTQPDERGITNVWKRLSDFFPSPPINSNLWLRYYDAYKRGICSEHIHPMELDKATGHGSALTELVHRVDPELPPIVTIYDVYREQQTWKKGCILFHSTHGRARLVGISGFRDKYLVMPIRCKTTGDKLSWLITTHSPRTVDELQQEGWEWADESRCEANFP
jgi:hypothetical protein